MIRIVEFELVRFGPPVLGLWCDDCLLPSAFDQELRVVAGMHVIGEMTMHGCTDCGQVHTIRRAP